MILIYWWSILPPQRSVHLLLIEGDHQGKYMKQILDLQVQKWNFYHVNRIQWGKPKTNINFLGITYQKVLMGLIHSHMSGQIL